MGLICDERRPLRLWIRRRLAGERPCCGSRSCGRLRIPGGGVVGAKPSLALHRAPVVGFATARRRRDGFCSLSASAGIEEIGNVLVPRGLRCPADD